MMFLYKDCINLALNYSKKLLYISKSEHSLGRQSRTVATFTSLQLFLSTVPPDGRRPASRHHFARLPGWHQFLPQSDPCTAGWDRRRATARHTECCNKSVSLSVAILVVTMRKAYRYTDVLYDTIWQSWKFKAHINCIFSQFERVLSRDWLTSNNLP